MNRAESVELLGEGQHAWNTWADEMLAQKSTLVETGDWTKERQRAWDDRARADFSGEEFSGVVNIAYLRFPGDVRFDGARFLARASFRGAKFFGRAHFSSAKFSESCSFESCLFRSDAFFSNAEFAQHVGFPGTTFEGVARFWDVVFSGEAHFNKINFRCTSSFSRTRFLDKALFHAVTFSGAADLRDVTFSDLLSVVKTVFSERVNFDQCTFENAAYFLDVSFRQEAVFVAARGRGVFRLHNVDFRLLPDFSEANFSEAPLLDGANLDSGRFAEKATKLTGAADVAAKWRALRRLAIQGLDHERELEFLKGEISARRGQQDRWVHLRFWVGWIYQWFSDFGRSIGRPLLWLGLSLLSFSLFYAARSGTLERPWFFSVATCETGVGDARLAALALSVRNAFPFAVAGSPERIEESYACLYGVQTGAFGSRTSLVPYEVAVAGVLQFFVSTTLIFLVGLGLRNRFRIR